MSTSPRERYSEKKKKEIVNLNEQKMATLQPSLSRKNAKGTLLVQQKMVGTGTLGSILKYCSHQAMQPQV